MPLRSYFKQTWYCRLYQRAFSLIELSAILAVSASAMIGFLLWTTPQESSRAQNNYITQERMQAISDAITAFRIEHNRLPCPSDPAATEVAVSPDGYSFGIEALNRDDTDGKRGVDCPFSEGSVPAYSLNLSGDYIKDAWGRRLRYAVSPALCGEDEGVAVYEASYSLLTPQAEALSRQRGCTPKDYRTRSGTLTVNNGVTAITKGAAFVVLSHGQGGQGALLMNGQTLGVASSGFETENTDGDEVYMLRSQSDDYDDLLLYRTKEDVEQDTMSLDRTPLDETACASVSSAIEGLNANEATLSSYDAGGINGKAGIATSLLAMQVSCINEIGGVTSTAIPIGVRCPGKTDNSTYYLAGGACLCHDNGWDNGCIIDWKTVSPPVVKDLELWLDAYDPENDGSAPANGATINEWHDKTKGTWRHEEAIPYVLEKGSLCTAPTYTTTGPAIDFDGNCLILNGDRALPLVGADFTVFVAYKVDDGWSNIFLTTERQSDGNFYMDFIASSTLIPRATVDMGASNIEAWKFSNPPAAPFVTGARVTSTAIDLIYAGDIGASTPITTSFPYPSGDSLVLGKSHNKSSTIATLNGKLYEILIYKRALSDAEIKLVSLYLGQKWGAEVAP